MRPQGWRFWVSLGVQLVMLGALVVPVVMAWSEASVALRSWAIMFIIATLVINTFAIFAIIHYRSRPGRAGIVRAFRSRQELQSGGYAVSDTLKSLPHGSRISVLARSARAWVSQPDLIKDAIHRGNLIELTFFLPDGDMSDYDKWGAADLEVTKAELSSLSTKNAKIKVHALPFTPTYSMALHETPDEYRVVLDPFSDLPLEHRHSLLLRSKKDRGAYLVEAAIALFAMYSKYEQMPLK